MNGANSREGETWQGLEERNHLKTKKKAPGTATLTF